jgi:hypothetical protein
MSGSSAGSGITLFGDRRNILLVNLSGKDSSSESWEEKTTGPILLPDLVIDADPNPYCPISLLLKSFKAYHTPPEIACTMMPTALIMHGGKHIELILIIFLPFAE